MQIGSGNMLNHIEVMTPTVLTSWNTAVYILIILHQCVWSPLIFSTEIFMTVELLIISYEQNFEQDAQWAYLKSRTWKVSRLEAASDSPRAIFQKNV